MLCLKKVYRDELLQLALLLSILRVNHDSFYDNIYDNLYFDNGTSWRSITPAVLRSHYVNPKSLDSVLLNYQQDLFADLNSLGRFNGGNFRHPDVTTYLLNIDRTAPLANTDPLPEPSTPQNQSANNVNEEQTNSLDMGISLTQEGDVAEESEHEIETQCEIEDVSLDQSEMSTLGNIKPMSLETQQNARKKTKINNSKENDLLMQKALHVLNEPEDEHDIFGKYIATELRSISSVFLRKKLKRRIQQAILEIGDEEERLSSISSACSNPHSAASYSGHTDVSNHPVQFNQQPFAQTVAQYLHTETESSYLNM